MIAWMEWRNVHEASAENQDQYKTFYDLGELGETMLKGYFEYDTVSRVQLGRPVAAEGRLLTDSLVPSQPPGYPPESAVWRHPSGRLMVPIVDPDTKEPVRDRKGRVPHLTGRIDLLSERSTPHKGLWVVDHKALARTPTEKGLDFDDQATGYPYVVWRWLGIRPRGVIWNVLLKEAPKEPRIVQSKEKGRRGEDTLSAAKDQHTLPRMYREALKDWGFISSSGTITSKPHADCLSSLLSRGWDPFFRRFELTRNEHELLSFEYNLISEYFDMVESFEDAARLYPNRSQIHCPTCPVNRVCLAIEDGSDWEQIVATHFTVGPDRKAVQEGVEGD